MANNGLMAVLAVGAVLLLARKGAPVEGAEVTGGVSGGAGNTLFGPAADFIGGLVPGAAPVEGAEVTGGVSGGAGNTLFGALADFIDTLSGGGGPAREDGDATIDDDVVVDVDASGSAVAAVPVVVSLKGSYAEGFTLFGPEGIGEKALTGQPLFVEPVETGRVSSAEGFYTTGEVLARYLRDTAPEVPAEASADEDVGVAPAAEVSAVGYNGRTASAPVVVDVDASGSAVATVPLMVSLKGSYAEGFGLFGATDREKRMTTPYGDKPLFVAPVETGRISGAAGFHTTKEVLAQYLRETAPV